jgi:hypothetical protein
MGITVLSASFGRIPDQPILPSRVITTYQVLMWINIKMKLNGESKSPTHRYDTYHLINILYIPCRPR